MKFPNAFSDWMVGELLCPLPSGCLESDLVRVNYQDRLSDISVVPMCTRQVPLEGQPKAQRVLLAPLRLHRQGSKLRSGGFPTPYFPSKALALSPRRPLLFRGSVVT